MKYIIYLLLVVSPLVRADTWDESFSKATTIEQCIDIADNCESRAESQTMSRNYQIWMQQAQGRRNWCRNRAESCKDDVREADNERREKQQERSAEYKIIEDDKIRLEEERRLVQTLTAPPEMYAICTKNNGDNSFNNSITIMAWPSKGGCLVNNTFGKCYGDFTRISITQVSGGPKNRADVNFIVDRINGTLEAIYSSILQTHRASYTCQKAIQGQGKL